MAKKLGQKDVNALFLLFQVKSRLKEIGNFNKFQECLKEAKTKSSSECLIQIDPNER